jgi:long-subunit fatty acid transport protein
LHGVSGAGSWKPRIFFGVASLVASVALAGSVSASPQEVLGFGPRTSAMASTGAASAEGWEAVHANPALLGGTDRSQLALGMVGAVFALEATGARGAEGLALPLYDNLTAGTIGLVVPLPFEEGPYHRLSLGLGFITPFDLVVRGRIQQPDRGQFPIADRVQSIGAQAALGADLGHGIRAGVGFAALAALEGSVLVATDASGRTGTQVEDTLIAAYAPVFGVTVDSGDGFRAGVVVRGELEAPFDVKIEVRDLGSLNIPPLSIAGTAQYDPWIVELEVAKVEGATRLALGASYEAWSGYPGAVEATVQCGYLPCAALRTGRPSWRDTLSPRVGIEQRFQPSRVVGMAVRGGYAFEPAAGPEQTSWSNVFEEARSVATVGYGMNTDRTETPFGIDVFTELQVIHGRDHDKTAGPVADRLGDTISTSGVIVAWGAASRVAF